MIFKGQTSAVRITGLSLSSLIKDRILPTNFFVTVQYQTDTLPVNVVVENTAVGAASPGFDFRAGRIGHSYPVHMSSLSGTKAHGLPALQLNF